MKALFPSLRHNWILAAVFVPGMLGMYFALCFTGYLHRLYRMNSYGVEAVDQNTVYFTVKGAEILDLSALQENNLVRDASLLLHSPASGQEYRLLYTQGKRDIFEGRYFSRWDFNGGNPACVLGHTMAKRQGNELAVLTAGNYPVRAVMPETPFIGVNSAAFFTDSILSDIPAEGSIFALASSAASAPRACFERLSAYFSGQGLAANEITFSRATLQSFLGYNDGLLLAMGGYFLLLFVSCLLLLLYWFRCRAAWRRVMHLLGEERLLLRTLLHFSGVLSASALTGGLLYRAAAGSMYFSSSAFAAGFGLTALIELAAVLAYGLAVKLSGRTSDKGFGT